MCLYMHHEKTDQDSTIVEMSIRHGSKLVDCQESIPNEYGEIQLKRMCYFNNSSEKRVTSLAPTLSLLSSIHPPPLSHFPRCHARSSQHLKPPLRNSLFLRVTGPNRGSLVHNDIAIVLDGDDASAAARGNCGVGVPDG